MSTAAQLQLEIDELKEQQTKWEKVHADANRQYSVGLWGVLIGILLIPVYGLGVLLILAGGLAALTNRGKRTEAKVKLASIASEVKEKRAAIMAAIERVETGETDVTE